MKTAHLGPFLIRHADEDEDQFVEQAGDCYSGLEDVAHAIALHKGARAPFVLSRRLKLLLSAVGLGAILLTYAAVHSSDDDRYRRAAANAVRSVQGPAAPALSQPGGQVAPAVSQPGVQAAPMTADQKAEAERLLARNRRLEALVKILRERRKAKATRSRGRSRSGPAE